MKKSLFTILFLTSIASAVSQNNDYIRARYQLAYKPSKTYKDIIKKENMLLLINQESSKFISLGNYMEDSLYYVVHSSKNKEQFISSMRELPNTSFRNTVKKDYQLDQIIVTEEILGDHFKYKEDLKLFQWVIDSEKKAIKGYNCQKATTHFAGRDYIAWFTGEIPISDGPYKFNGLPGLIIELYDTDDHYHYVLTSFRRLKTPNRSYEEKKDYFDVDKQKFFQLKMDHYKNPLKKLEARGIILEISAQEKRKMIEEELKSNDNPIELIDF